jgi:hypothetical protein
MLHPEKIHIIDFKITKGQIESPFEFVTTDVKGYSFKSNYNLAFNLEDKLVKARLYVVVTADGEDRALGTAQGLFELNFVYHVENLSDLVEKEGQQLTIDAGLSNALASITYSTTRGILMTRFQGTSLANFILPVIDPNRLAQDQANHASDEG